MSNTLIHTNPNQRPVWQYWGSDMNQAMVSEFVSAIREGREPSVTGVDGLRAVEVVAAAYDSAQAGQPVKVQQV